MVIRGRSLIFGAWAQIRLVRMQARLDCAHGRDTAGFVTGHRGSPLGGVDFAMGNAMRPLDARRVRFMPAINEELAAAAALGSQRVASDACRTVEGVFALRYG